MSYYHTYRPQRFADLVGQDHIAQVLQAALKTDRLSHAYLFAGTRGTGKTTTARLLAKAVNCLEPDKQEPCNQCLLCQSIAAGSCMDVIEIDAASNRGIEEIRQLQDQARFGPSQAKKKIFIIDEVHMLTKEAFNALLKTLEEPPHYLLFILATTEAHKLPATILSRCQRFDFLTPTSEVIHRYLERIVASEQLTIEPNALVRLTELANGSFRDSSTLLEQLATQSKKIDLPIINQLLGLPDADLVNRFLVVLDGQTDTDLPVDLATFFQRGGSPVAFTDSSFNLLARQLQSGGSYRSSADILSVLCRS